MRFINNKHDDDSYELEVETDDLDEEDFYYPSSIFRISLILLIIYFLLGAYYQSKNRNITLVDSMFDCYSMLSMSKLPDSFYSLTDKKATLEWDSFQFYNKLKKNPTKNAKQLVIEQLEGPISTTTLDSLSTTLKQEQEVGKSTYLNIIFDQLTWDLIYFIIGLNLVSMCAHFARICFSSNKKDQPIDSDFKRDGNEFDNNKNVPKCNGHVATVMGSFDNGKLFRDLQQQPLQSGNNNPPTNQYVDGANQQQQYIYPSTAANDIISNQQDQAAINMTELYIVNQDQQTTSSPIEAAYSSSSFTTNNNNNNNHAQIASDVSFASDRSTNSLCLHHQQQAQMPLSSSSANLHQQQLTGSSTTLIQQQGLEEARLVIGSNRHIHNLHGNNTFTGTLPMRQQHCDNNNILPQVYTTTLIKDNNHRNNTNVELEDDDMDTNEMDRMLKTCLRKGAVNNKQQQQQQLIPIRSSSSSVQLSQHQHHFHHDLNDINNSILNINDNMNHNNNSSSTSSNSLYTTNPPRIGWVGIDTANNNNGTLQTRHPKNKTVRVRMADQQVSSSPNGLADMNAAIALMEQDRSSLNTIDTNTSNTISSSASSRTIKQTASTNHDNIINYHNHQLN